MDLATVHVAFAVIFPLFVLVTVVLIVLTVRFTYKRSRIDRQEWLARQSTPGPVTALVMAGGGTRGATQVGMLQVLAEQGFRPDHIYGASVGAVNGAAFAGDPSEAGMEHLTKIWQGLRGEDVYPQRRVHGPWIFLQQRESVHPNTGLRKIIEQGIQFERLEEAAIPFEVVATSLEDGREQWLTSGPAVEAILASAAIPAIFPPVEIDGRQLIDGGVVDNVPISRAIEGGATRIFVLLCGPLTYTPPISRRPVEAMLNALFIAVHARFSQEMARLPSGVEVIVFSGGGESSRDYTDFSDTDALIAAGRAEALEVLRRHGLAPVGIPTGLHPQDGSAVDDPAAFIEPRTR
ncbi:MAG TPA: patatin-like phospholipase family protein [Acidimicrobiales bacterium]|jgi:NTE family protein|nr:patatin-like phospholipase family protein [Acidimicrobiales bacterium]